MKTLSKEFTREVRVVVHCQYFENYAFESGGEAWKPKGGSTFSFIIDSDDWLYGADDVKEVVNEVIDTKYNNAYQRFEAVDYEVIFQEATCISDDVAMLCKQLWERREQEDLLRILP